jgi:hypothetical protein
MRYIASLAIGLASVFVPALGYFMMGMHTKAIVLLCVVVASIAIAPVYLAVILPFSGLMQLNQAITYNRAINDSKMDRTVELLNRHRSE